MSVSITADTPVASATKPADVSLGSKGRMPEFSLAGKVILVSGAARGLGLTQAEALLEAGAKVYGLDRLEEPVSNPVFYNLAHGASCLTMLDGDSPPSSSRFKSEPRRNWERSCTIVVLMCVTRNC